MGGANIGKYSLLATKTLPNTKIIAFEPVKKTFENLTKNVEGKTNITLVNCGLFSSECTKEINLFNSNTHSSLYDSQGVNYSVNDKIAIQLITGDSYLEEQNINQVDFLKIDIEGAEYDALLGLEKALQKGAIKAIQFEYGYINLSSKNLLGDFYSLLESHNYVLGKIYPKRVDFRKYLRKHEDFIGPNFIAVHKSEKILIEHLGKE
jgi:FkbM family methyltransferase